MKKIIIVIIVGIVVFYSANWTVAQHLTTYIGQCYAQLDLSSRLKMLHTEDDKEKLASDFAACVDSKKTFLDSLFLSKKKIQDGISFNNK